MVGMRMIEIWRLKPVPRKVASVGGELFNEYLRKMRELSPNDLGTDWFGRMMATLFNYSSGTSDSFSFVDVTGTSRTKNIKQAMYAYYSTTPLENLLNVHGTDVGAFIGIGTGTAPPSKQDYKLGNEVARQPAQARYADGASCFTVSSAFTLSTDTNITEVGLYYKTGYTSYYVLLDHTVLSSPVTFPANTAMAVTYYFSI